MRLIDSNSLVAAIGVAGWALVGCGGEDNPSNATGGASQAGSSAVSSGGGSAAIQSTGGANGTSGGGTSIAGNASTSAADTGGAMAANSGSGGSGTAGNASTGGTSAAGGLTNTGGTSAAGGLANTADTSAAGGRASSGGSNNEGTGGLATGGVSSSGGGSPTGGMKSTGGTLATGGNLATGGSSVAGGSSSAVGGRSSGICPGGTYPAPTLGTATRIYDTSGNGQFEGTVWYGDSLLLFSNMSTGSTTPVVPSAVDRLSLPATVDVLVSDSGSNGMALDVDGSLLACSHKVQGIVKIDTTTSTITTVVNTDSNGKHFNSPNDLTVRTDGTIYFSDPDFQLGSSRTSETGTKGVYRVSPSRQVSLIDGTFGEPNGIALSPDESTLYVADYSANAIRKFAVAADGGASGKANFATVASPDGVAVDCAGNTYWASNSAGKVIVLSPTGTQLGTITLTSGVTNLAFGGTDHKTLYISVGMSVYSVPMKIPGFPY